MADKEIEIETADFSRRRPAAVRARALQVMSGTNRTENEARRARLRKLEAPYRSTDDDPDEAA
jgi:hypothetical protein